MCNMKSLWLSEWAGQQIKEKYQNGCHSKTVIKNHWIFDDMKLLMLWLQGECTDNANNDVNNNTNDDTSYDDVWRTKIDCIKAHLVDKLNELEKCCLSSSDCNLKRKSISAKHQTK